MALPVSPPVKPMLAAPVSDFPQSGDQVCEPKWVFEPKWDGFRCLVFVDPTASSPVYLQSRTEKSLNRYFPEVVRACAESIERPLVLDGELVVAVRDDQGQRLDWDALGERVHPAASRIRLLAEQTPAELVAFDVLAVDELDLRTTPFAARRERLVGLGLHSTGMRTTPATTDLDTARDWWRLFEGAGLDGVIGKPADGHYLPGKRALSKIKHTRTADCVVAGMRWHANSEPGSAVGSLLLGLYDQRGVLHHVGVVGALPAARRRALATELESLRTTGEHPWLGEHASDGRRVPGTVNRWRSEQPWEPLRPERVVEVTYDHTEGAHPARFRHTAQFLRWRPDRDPGSCGYDQLDEPARYDLDAVLRGDIHTRCQR